MRKTITFDNFLSGDHLITKEGSKCKVLAKQNLIFARSCFDINLDTFQEWISIYDAKNKGWKFLQPEEAWPMTHKELETMMGRKIKIITK